ncbi:MAG: dTDP-glucose 4,6-dehydratase [Clostridiaceae bacterium]|jgi:dTDP-glucose 4,6-dehydratase|nr:dTDP-glucose 4,6-dehydratase [Clostridiaceae bacterium]
MKTILVTGGAGFIGSNFINRHLERYDGYHIINLDKLTYAANPEYLKDVECHPCYSFIQGDICDAELVGSIMEQYRPDAVVNFAAESHVDRSIGDPGIFAVTNIIGVMTLMDAARRSWRDAGYEGKIFLQVSTDEVYGSITNDQEPFTEESPLLPNSPYSASKASADLMVRAYIKTYGFPAIITRCCNNYGPCQNPEKFIPTCILSAMENKPIPIYGDGLNIREWIYVQDHCDAIAKAMFEGVTGEIYNIGSSEEFSNIDLAKHILAIMNKPLDLVQMVNDRPGHDFRYALDSRKAMERLGFKCSRRFEERIMDTVKWYLSAYSGHSA